MKMFQLRLLRRVVVLVVGGLVVLTGVVMLFTPGPAILVIPAGLAILATEYQWAKSLLSKFRQHFGQGVEQIGGWWSRLAGRFTGR